MSNADRAIGDFVKEVQPITKRWPATLSNSLGDITPNASAAVAGSGGQVYCVMPDGSVVKAYNNRVPPVTGLRVWVGYEPHNPSFLRVLDFNSSYTDPAGLTGFGPHEHTHVFLDPLGGTDVPFIPARQLLPLRVSVVSGLVVKIEPSPEAVAGGWDLSTTSTIDLSGDVPSIGSLWALLYLDAGGTFIRLLGSNVGAFGSLAYSNIPAVPSGGRALAAVKLYQGQTAIQENHDAEDIADLRFTNPGGASGGGSGEFSTLQTDNGALTVGTAAQAFGDSITVGQGASDSAHEYISLLAAAKNWTITNNAVSGNMAADQADEIFALSVLPATLSTYMIGTNDEKLYDTADLRLDFESILLAELAYLAIPHASLILGTDTGRVTYSGSWTDIPVWGLGKYASSAGDSATFDFYGPSLVICPLAYASDRTDTNLGTFSVTIDGVLYGNYSSSFRGVIDTIVAGRDYAPYAIVIPGLADAQHTVIIELTNSEHVYFNWAAPIRGTRRDSGPYVYLSNVIRQTAAGYIAHGGSEANVTLFNTLMRSAASYLASLGLNVALVDNVNGLDPDTDLDADGIHPNDAGHALIAQAFQAAMNSVAYASDRQNATYPGFTRLDVREAPTPLAVPTPGEQSLFIDVADGHVKRIDDAGVVVDVEGSGVLPLTTKGDLLGFDTAPARVPVGLDGTFLKANSGAALGVAWATLGQYRQLLYIPDGAGSFNFLVDGDGLPLSGLYDLQ